MTTVLEIETPSAMGPTEQMLETILRDMAKKTGIPLDELVKDYAKSDFSGLRAIAEARAESRLSGRQYQLLQDAFDLFNTRLFAGELPQVLIVLHRHSKYQGYFWANRFTLRGVNDAKDAIVHEIALNPECFLAAIPTEETLSTLVHEQAHLWQQEFGKKLPRKAYHNKEWAAKMEEIGLMPSNTGEKGGKRTGQRMSHYIIPGGPFAVACARFLEQVKEAVLVNAVPKITAAKSDPKKLKACFECLTCKQKAWAKPTAKLICGDCNRPMLSKSANVE